MIDLSVITATADRTEHLRRCLAQFGYQHLGSIRCEHIVISDGPDEQARSLCESNGTIYLQLPERRGVWGAFARDLGIQAASGRYVCFWDDDNIYHPHAVATLLETAEGVDIGVVRIRYLFRRSIGSALIPRSWNGRFRLGDVDTMCVCVRRHVALRSKWADGDTRRGEDFRWLHRLQQSGASIRYAPEVIGMHL